MQLTAKSVSGTAAQVMHCDKLIKLRTIAERNRAFLGGDSALCYCCQYYEWPSNVLAAECASCPAESVQP